MIELHTNFKAYDRIWLHVGRNGRSEQRHAERPAGGRCKSVYVIEMANGEMLEQCITRPQETRPPGRGWSFFMQRPRFSVWRRRLRQGRQG